MLVKLNMSLEGPSLVQCSSLAQVREKKQVLIYYPVNDTKVRDRGVLVYVPVDNLIHPQKTTTSRSYKEVEHMLPLPEDGELNVNMGCIVTTVRVGNLRPSLYLFGGLDPPSNSDYMLAWEYVVKGVQRYELQKLPAKETGSFERCNDMPSGMYHPLLTQVGDDSIFVLGYGKTEFDANFKLSFHKYNFIRNEWASKSLFDSNKCETPNSWVRDNLAHLPHVVIGNKLHVSFGTSSFTYDTENDTWYDCKLFETFWSKKIRKKKKSGRPSLSNFYGKEAWIGAIEAARKRKKEPTQFAGGPPFGFYGRGIIWDENILLGIYYGENCQVVAYLLDNALERVVKSQPISFNTILGMHDAPTPYGAHFVDLGHGCFGLVHFLGDEDEEDIWERTYSMELLTFKAKRIGTADDDQFLEYEFISNEVIIKDLPNHSYSQLSSVFAVDL
jgi:hypothetical protein